MMKKFFSALTALMLLLACVPALAEDYTAAGVGTWTLPDGFEMDDASYADESTDTSKWLFLAYDGSVIIDVAMDQDADLAGESLFNYSAEDLQAFIEDAAASYSDDVATYTYMETITAGSVPFLLFSVADSEEGDFYYAETLADGWFIYLMCYADSATDLALPEASLDTFRTILASFVPDV